MFLIPSVSATEVIDFDFLIDKNDTVVLAQTRAYLGEPDFFLPENSQYLLKLKNVDGQVLWDIPLAVNFVVLDPLVNVSQTLAMVTLNYVPYYKILEVYHDERLIYITPLNFLCNGDTQCSVPENYVSCPGDCPSGTRDGFCDAVDDGKCDKDCLGKDRDCQGTIKSMIMLAFLLFLILFAGGMAVLVLRYHPQNKKKENKNG